MNPEDIKGHITVRITLKESCTREGQTGYFTTFKGEPVKLPANMAEFVVSNFKQVIDMVHMPDIKVMVIIIDEDKTPYCENGN